MILMNKQMILKLIKKCITKICTKKTIKYLKQRSSIVKRIKILYLARMVIKKLKFKNKKKIKLNLKLIQTKITLKYRKLKNNK